MKKLRRMGKFILIAWIALPLSAAEAGTREFSIVIDRAQAEYTVEVGGSSDPENLEILIENLGAAPVVNPRMSVNGLYDWYDVRSIVEEATRGCGTDEEKALSIWWWMLYKRYQLSPQDRSALHPVRGLNGYGYGICGHTAAWMKCLLSAAGVRARVHELWGHTISEAWWDGAWHMLDANVKVFYLARDNHSIASLATLEHDGWLIERGIHPRDAWERVPEPKSQTEQFVRWITTYKDNYEENSYDQEIARGYSMAMTLRPGESLVRWWEPRLGKHEGRADRTPQRYANGQLVWAPDLRHTDITPYLAIPKWGNVSTSLRDGKGPAVHVADLQDNLYTRPSVFTVPVASPYPIVGGRFRGTLVKRGSGRQEMVSVFFGEPGWRPGDLFNFGQEAGEKEVDLDLDAKVRRPEALYGYGIGIAMRGSAEANPPAQAGLEAFRLVSDIQVSPHALPALTLGNNLVRFRHQSPGPVKVRITHRWREVDGQSKPGLIQRPVAPEHGREVASLSPVLRWPPAESHSPGASVSGYQVMLSARPDCRWPLAPALYQSVGSGAAAWTVPATYLNPGTTYYWKVRARDSAGNIGDWGPVFRFQTAENAR